MSLHHENKQEKKENENKTLPKGGQYLWLSNKHPNSKLPAPKTQAELDQIAYQKLIEETMFRR